MNNKSHWSESRIEEVISIGWLITAILCFGFDFGFAGWLFMIKAIFDMVASIYFGYREAIRARGQK